MMVSTASQGTCVSRQPRRRGADRKPVQAGGWQQHVCGTVVPELSRDSSTAADIPAAAPHTCGGRQLALVIILGAQPEAVAGPHAPCRRTQARAQPMSVVAGMQPQGAC